MTDNLVERLRSRLESVYDYQTQGPEWREDLLAREAANEIARLQEALAAAEAERDEARAANERDRTEVIDAVNAISDAFKRRRWLLGDSRGSYEWDDDRFRQEFRDAIAEFEPQVERLRKIGADRSNCPTTQAGVDAARSSLPALLAETRKKALEECVELAKQRGFLSIEDIRSLSADEAQP